MTVNNSEGKETTTTGRKYLNWLILVLVVGITLTLFVLRDRVQGLDSLGYLGAFLATLLSSATILIPVPGIAVVFVLGDVWNPLYIGLVSGLGSALGELTGYFAGYTGQDLFKDNKYYIRINRWMQHWQALSIFLFALIPNPFFDLVGMAAGVMRYGMWKFLFFCLLGKTIRCVLIAYAGLWGLEWVRSWFAS